MEKVNISFVPNTYKDFMDAYEMEMDVLECYDKDGVELDAETEIPPETKVISFSRRSGIFDVVLDL